MSSRAVSALTIVVYSLPVGIVVLNSGNQSLCKYHHSPSLPLILTKVLTNNYRAKLKEEGNLRDDIDIPEDDNNIPTSIQDIKTQIKIALHPELKDKYVQEQELKNTTEFEKLRDQIDGTAKD